MNKIKIVAISDSVSEDWIVDQSFMKKGWVTWMCEFETSKPNLSCGEDVMELTKEGTLPKPTICPENNKYEINFDTNSFIIMKQ